jgi:hypothetical protein
MKTNKHVLEEYKIKSLQSVTHFKKRIKRYQLILSKDLPLLSFWEKPKVVTTTSA